MRFEEEKPVMSLKRKCNYRAVRADADIEDLFDCATSQNFVPVVDDTGVLIGIITRKSILNFLIRSYNKCCDGSPEYEGASSLVKLQMYR